MDEDVKEAQAKEYNLDLQHAEKVLSMRDINEEEPAEVEEASAPRRRMGVIIQDPEEITTSVIMHSKVQFKNKGKEILLKEPKPLKGQAQIDMDEAFAKQLEAELNANINSNDVIEQVKRSEKHDNAVMSEIRPIFKKHYNLTQAFLEKVKDEVTVQEEGNKRQDESLEQEIAKKQRMDEEAEELKEIYKLWLLMMMMCTLKLLLWHQREDLEALWKLVKERFETTKPKNFLDDFLINTLKIMFEKPNVEVNMLLLVEKKYPLTHFTLQQMLDNVRLEVKEESEMSLELLRTFTLSRGSVPG
nr:hypothetical protein [Tanacetum cinerariifolium]